MSLAEQPQNYAEEAVQKYGYQQEFRREIKRFASFAIGFSFISTILGIFNKQVFIGVSLVFRGSNSVGILPHLPQLPLYPQDMFSCRSLSNGVAFDESS